MIKWFLKKSQETLLLWAEGLFWKKILKPIIKFLIGWMPPYKD